MGYLRGDRLFDKYDLLKEVGAAEKLKVVPLD